MDSIDQEKQKLAADAEREFTRLWRAWRTVHEMCQDRVGNTFSRGISCISAYSLEIQGYELAEEEVRITLDEFRERFADPDGAAE